MSEQPLNLDKVAVERAQEMVRLTGDSVDGVKKPVETLERLVTKTLGVLQEQGVYAMMLFLFSRTSDEDKVARVAIRSQLYEALKALPAFTNDPGVPTTEADAQTALQFYSGKVLDKLDTLLLVRDIYEQTLIYARYGAKARGGGS